MHSSDLDDLYTLNFDFALTWIDVLCIDGDVSIPVWSTLLMPSAEGMEYLMHHHSFAHTRWPNWYILFSSPSTNWWVATEEK